MSDCGCKKKKCNSAGDDIASIKGQLNELQSLVDDIAANTKFLSCGHPIVMIQNINDIAAFDTETGKGSDCWEGWAACNGATHFSESDDANYTTPNLLDKFIVGAGDTYDVDDTGGEAEHTLTIPEIPEHGHTLTDAGHTHTVTDTGHTHSLDQEPHNHAGSGGDHAHAYDGTTSVWPQGSHFGSDGEDRTYVTDDGSDAGHSHTYSGTTDAASGTVTIDDASIDISVGEAFTGVSIGESTSGVTMAETGGGEPHNNLPPYYSLMFVVKI